VGFVIPINKLVLPMISCYSGTALQNEKFEAIRTITENAVHTRLEVFSSIERILKLATQNKE
jgi:hypothetical protein